jgi:hypothetical protein
LYPQNAPGFAHGPPKLGFDKVKALGLAEDAFFSRIDEFRAEILGIVDEAPPDPKEGWDGGSLAKLLYKK